MADACIRIVRSAVHPYHEENVSEFFGKYGWDYEKIHKAFLDAASDELQYPSLEDTKQDPNYKRRIADQSKPKAGSNHDETVFLIFYSTLFRGRATPTGMGETSVTTMRRFIHNDIQLL
jgi:hypothetical protein